MKLWVLERHSTCVKLRLIVIHIIIVTILDDELRVQRVV